MLRNAGIIDLKPGIASAHDCVKKNKKGSERCHNGGNSIETGFAVFHTHLCTSHPVYAHQSTLIVQSPTDTWMSVGRFFSRIRVYYFHLVHHDSGFGFRSSGGRRDFFEFPIPNSQFPIPYAVS